MPHRGSEPPKPKRGFQIELPKGGRVYPVDQGGPQEGRNSRGGKADESPFETAQAELFEEAGVWIHPRPEGSFRWLGRRKKQ